VLIDKTLKIRGTLIYHEGKAALELTEETDALLSVTKPVTPTVPTVVQSLGSVSMQGEITDPKCFLGVMKPGDGRPHRSCAIRCVAGGIPPLLYVNNGHGQRNGYVLVGAQGEPINDQVLGYVGKGVHVRGRLEQVDNWFILYVDKPIVATRLLPGLGEPIAMCRYARRIADLAQSPRLARSPARRPRHHRFGQPYGYLFDPFQG
jgi:hypothetical protein